MGLAVEVGMLADLLENDPEGAEWLREQFDLVNSVLAENNLPPHDEPEVLGSLDNRVPILGYPYSFLHYLRRIAAHVSEHPGWQAEAFPDSDDPAADPVVDKHSALMRSHLLCHSDCEGFYLPMQFQEIIFDDKNRIPGAMLGSSFMLMQELTAIAPSLGINLANGELGDEEVVRINHEVESESPLWIEKLVWLSLFEAARLSPLFITV